MALSIPALIGHLHPVLVHLPIGILLLACLFLWQARRDKSDNFQKTINVILGLGMISAIASCITGWVLARSGDYEEGSTDLHQWMGIAVALVSVITFYLRRKSYLLRWQTLLAILLVVLLVITGHLGGSLTHGSDYLTAPLAGEEAEDTARQRKPITNLGEAVIYSDIIQPVFQSKCYSCHGPRKQKGKLRLDAPDMIRKGGKDGVVIVPGNAQSSELVKRILLPLNEEHHMAPKDKRQLTETEKLLIQWWVNEGADFSKKVKEAKVSGKIMTALSSLQQPAAESPAAHEYPQTETEPADPAAVEALRQLGAIVLPIAQNSHYLDVDFLTATQIRSQDLALLLPIRKQIVSVRASHRRIGDSALIYLGQCEQLVNLDLGYTEISDKGLEHLLSLKNLRILNLVACRVTAGGILSLRGLDKLRAIYLFQTQVRRREWPDLQKAFPKANLDSGGYALPFLPSDTMIVRAPKTPA